MEEKKLLKDIISKNKDNIAFIIGNGIHRHYKYSAISWEDLLKKLWKQYVNESLETFPNQGISNTEFYDLIELNYMRSFNTIDYKDKLRTYIQSVDTAKIEILKLKCADTTIKDAADKLKNTIDNLRKYTNPEIQDLSYEELIIGLSYIVSNESIRRIYMNSIKKQIAKDMAKWKNDDVSIFVQYAKNINAPIMTTNYDKVLEKSINCKKIIKKKFNSSEGMNKRDFSDFYPWNVYYSDKEYSDFGIWHINGILDYPRSIKLGLCDYMGCVEKARKMILQGRSVFGIDTFNENDTNYWPGHNTWLHYIFNKNLFIFGLGLNEDEVFLRWLLIQRAKFSTTFQRPVKGWYVTKDINDGKKIFLEALGFEVIIIKDFKTLYEKIWK